MTTIKVGNGGFFDCHSSSICLGDLRDGSSVDLIVLLPSGALANDHSLSATLPTALHLAQRRSVPAYTTCQTPNPRKLDTAGRCQSPSARSTEPQLLAIRLRPTRGHVFNLGGCATSDLAPCCHMLHTRTVGLVRPMLLGMLARSPFRRWMGFQVPRPGISYRGHPHTVSRCSPPPPAIHSAILRQRLSSTGILPPDITFRPSPRLALQSQSRSNCQESQDVLRTRW